MKITIFFLFLLCGVNAMSQDFKSLEDFDNHLDKTAVETGFMINRTPVPMQMIEYLREKNLNVKNNSEEKVNSATFKFLSEKIEAADFLKRKRSEKMSKKLNLSKKEQELNAEINIGLIEVDVNFLNEEEIKENIKLKKEGKKIKTKYEKISVLSASLSQDKFYQGNLNFTFDPSFFQVNKKSEIEKLEIDFNDNKGYVPIELKKLKTIEHQFHSTGGQVIKIKVATSKKTTIFLCPIEIVFLYRPQELLSTVIYPDSAPSQKNLKVATSVGGADVSVFPSCDGIFDKPILVAEGFDNQ